MRVIIVTDYPDINGGAGKVALESALALTEAGIDVLVFCTVGNVPEDLSHRLQITSLEQTKITDQPLKDSLIGGLWNREVAHRFQELLQGYDPQDTVIHIHSWRDGTTLSFMPEVIRKRFRFLVTAHDYGLACPIAGFYDERAGKICNRRGLSAACIGASCTQGQFIRKSWFVARHALQVHRAKLPSRLKHLIVVTPLNEKVIRPYLSPHTRVHTVRNPISVIDQGRSPAEENAPYLYIGRLSPEKGVSIALEACQRAGLPIQVIGAGVLKTGLREQYPKAQFLGWCDRETTQAQLRQARALIFPSIWYEAQGMVVDEAAANGIPTIVSDVTAAADTVTRWGHGTTFPTQNVEKLAELLSSTTDEQIKKWSEMGYANYWKEPATMSLHVQQLLQVYAEVLSEDPF